MSKRIRLGALFFLFPIVHAVATDTCKTWFEQSKLKPGPDCLTKCAALSTGMDTFFCPQSCPEFCRSQTVDEKVLGGILYYPGLTPAERQLVRQYPKQAIIVFRQKEKAESAAVRQFNRDAQHDESDAFRHFVWAALLAKELGPDLAKKFLDAHEAGGRTDDPSRAMDLANNRAGLLTAERLTRENRLTQDQVEKEAMEALKNKTLIVLKPRGGLK